MVCFRGSSLCLATVGVPFFAPRDAVHYVDVAEGVGGRWIVADDGDDGKKLHSVEIVKMDGFSHRLQAWCRLSRIEFHKCMYRI